MKFLALTSLFAALAAAQVPAASPVAMAMSPAMAAAAPGATQTVIVGGTAGLVFSPPFMMAAVGTQVDFVFLQKNHSVVQSTLQTPCKPKAGGFNFGFNPNAAGSIINAPKFSITVNDSQPIWVYCAQKEGTHCGHSMVFAVNPNPDITQMNSFRAYQESAIQQNGTAAGVLSVDALAGGGAQAAAATPVASTVTVAVGGASAAAATGSSSGGGIAAGSGETGTGETCTCSCMCAPGAVPRADAVGNFGGWAGMLP